MCRVCAPLALVILTLAAIGCEAAPEPPADARVTYDTVGGVVHVVSGSRGAWVRGGSWNVDRHGVVIGTVGETGAAAFGRVTGVVVGRDGHIYIGDADAAEVRVFSPAGVFLRRFGGRGDAPGQFLDISGLTRAPEGIAALDGRLGRVTVFRPGGSVARVFALDRPYQRVDRSAVMRFDERGRYYDPVSLASGAMTNDVAIVVYGRDGQPTDTLRIARVEVEPLTVTGNGVPVVTLPVPFQPRPSVAVGHEGRIYHAAGDEYRITVVDPAGDTLRVLRRRVHPRPVTEAERDAAVAAVERRYVESGVRPPDEIEIPAVKPVIADLLVDDLGNLWVQMHADADWTHLEWAVHDPAGRFLGTVATPRMRVMHIGADHVAGVMVAEDGTEQVAVLPIRRS